MSDVTKININGVEYASVEQMPPGVRAEYLQALAALREANAVNAPVSVTKTGLTQTVVRESFTFNGREYKSRDELPPEARALFDQLAEMSPDVKTNEVKIETFKSLPDEVRVVGTFGNAHPTAEKASSLPWMLVKILGAVVLVLLVLLGIVIFRHKG